MLASLPSPSLIFTTRPQDYSPGFQNMMNRVVFKINRHRANKKIVVANIVHPSLDQAESALRNIAILQKTYRKNSPNSSRFFSMPRNSTQSEWHPGKKSSTPRITARNFSNLLQLKRSRCLTEPVATLGVSLSQKINEYNQCLRTRTVKFQQKDKQAVCLENIQLSERLPMVRETLSSIKKCENIKKNKKWMSFRSKVMENCEGTARELDFKPWETNYEELQH